MLRKLFCYTSLGLCLICAGCSNEESTKEEQVVAETHVEEQSEKQIAVQEEYENTGEDEYEINENMDEGEQKVNELVDAPVWSPEFVISYMSYMNFDVHNFSKEMKDLNNRNNKLDPSSMFYVDSFFLNNLIAPKYEQMYTETNFIYVGEMKDEKPDGYGMLIELKNVGYENHIIKQMLYQGMFKKGRYDGFGLLYDPFIGGNSSVEQSSDSQEIEVKDLEYMGYFEDGLPSGKGIYITYSGNYNSINFSEDGFDAAMENVTKGLTISSGEFKKGLEDGEVKKYKYGCLIYEGTMKKGKPSKKGLEYYLGSTQKKYEGEFLDGVYWGKGTLYDQKGNKVCSGQWKNNMCGVINAEDYISSVEKEDFIRLLIAGGYDLEGEEAQALIKQGDMEEEYNIIREEMLISGNAIDFSETTNENYIDLDANRHDYIFPESSVRYLTSEDMWGLDKATLRLGRNEIYARHGRKFQTEDLNQYFSSKPWYNGYLSAEEFDDSVLNFYEKANLDIIKAAEAGRYN